MKEERYRLITRADFDGVVAGGLLIELNMIDEIMFAEPKDMQDGRVPVTDRDVTTNLPYVEGVGLCFDHHVSETVRIGVKDNHVIDPTAPSAARVVYDYFGGQLTFPAISTEMMDAVDQADSARYSDANILAPQGWTLLNFIMDPRTGLNRFDDFTISHEQLMKDMMVYCRHHPIEEILQIPDVAERVHRYLEHEEAAELQLTRCSSVTDDVVVADLRAEPVIYCCNRFLIYALFPNASISVHLMASSAPGRTHIAAGKSILNRTSKANLGLLMLEYGGGGHEAAATCHVDDADAERIAAEIVSKINAAG